MLSKSSDGELKSVAMSALEIRLMEISVLSTKLGSSVEVKKIVERVKPRVGHFTSVRSAGWWRVFASSQTKFRGLHLQATKLI